MERAAAIQWILLDDVVEVATCTDDDRLPSGILRTQELQEADGGEGRDRTADLGVMNPSL